MTLDELERLAKEATPGKRKCTDGHSGMLLETPDSVTSPYGNGHDAALIAALDRDTVLSLLRVVRAAVEWRNHPCPANVEAELCLAIDALAALNLKDET